MQALETTHARRPGWHRSTTTLPLLRRLFSRRGAPTDILRRTLRQNIRAPLWAINSHWERQGDVLQRGNLPCLRVPIKKASEFSPALFLWEAIFSQSKYFIFLSDCFYASVRTADLYEKPWKSLVGNYEPIWLIFSSILPILSGLLWLKLFTQKNLPKTLPQKSAMQIVGEFDLQYFFTLMIN